MKNKLKYFLSLILACAIVFGIGLIKQNEVKAKNDVNPYITFSSDTSFTIEQENSDDKHYNKIEYAIAKSDSATPDVWKEWDGKTVTSGMSSDSKYYLFFRGTNNTNICNGDSWIIKSSGLVDCSGDIETLLDYATVQASGHPTVGIYAFANMFESDTCLKSAPDLNIQTVPEGAYSAMFMGCTNLVDAPKITATTIGYWACGYMFSGCTSLSAPPNFSTVTTVGDYGFQACFKDCKSMTTEEGYTLSATNLGEGCYTRMFANCESIVNPVVLPATSVPYGGYFCMFQGCKKLSTPSTLSATTIGKGAYFGMFDGCIALTLPSDYELPAQTVTTGAYFCMFQDCKSITSIPNNMLAKATKIENATKYTTPDEQIFITGGMVEMFGGCSSLTDVSGLKLNATDIGTYSYQGMFRDCIKLTKGVSSLPATTLKEHCYDFMYKGCKELVTASSFPAATITTANFCFKSMYEDCPKLTTLPEVNATDIASGAFYQMFKSCDGITTIPSNYIKGTTFHSAVNYGTDKSPIWVGAYTQMFQDCDGLKDISSLVLPATVLNEYCYSGMFEECNRITAIMKINTENITLANNSYKDMFKNCESLYIQEIAYETTGDIHVLSIPSDKTTNSFTDMFRFTNGAFIGTPTKNHKYKIGTETNIVISSDQPFSIKTSTGNATWSNVTLHYGYKGINGDWPVWNGTKIDAIYDEDNKVYSLYLYGDITDVNTATVISNQNKWIYEGNSAVTITGADLEILLDFKKGESGHKVHPIMGNYCFANIFEGWPLTKIPHMIDDPTLTTGCYKEMFKNCTKLTDVGAGGTQKSLAPYCYEGMFEGCTSLTKAPTLQAETLAEGCYKNMFKDCTGITTIEKFNDVQLANYCYEGMFSGCSNLLIGQAAGSVGSKGGFLYVSPSHATGKTNWGYNMFEGTKTTANFSGTPEAGKTYGQNYFGITYELDGGLMIKDNPTFYEAGLGIDSFNDATKAGKKFYGWYDQQEGGHRIYSIPATAKGDITLYARWVAPTPSPTPDPQPKDESCEKVIGPTWHWNNDKGICEDIGVVGTKTR